MNSIPFLTVDGESISLNQAITYMRESGLFSQVLADVLRQHFLRKKLQDRSDLQVDSFAVDQSVMDFRIQSQLMDHGQFQQWLASNKMTYEEFRNQLEFRLRVDLLKEEVYQTEIETFFKQQKPFLDRFVLSRIILDNPKKATEIYQAILNDPSQFESLARQHSLTEDRAVNGMMGAIGRGQMPESLEKAVDSAKPGDLIGPLAIDGKHCLFKFEKKLDASLENPELKQSLREQIFDRWVNTFFQKMDIKLEVKAKA